MKAVLNKLRDVLLVTERDVKPSEKVKSEKEMAKNSTTSGITGLEVLIMSGLVLSLVQQIVSASLLQRLGVNQETQINSNKDYND
jgi:hypothetical protein